MTDAYLCQLQLTMACVGATKAHFVVLREMSNGRGGTVRELAVTQVDRDKALLDVIEPELVEFHEEAREDDEPYPPNNVAQLRAALLDARAESVGEERLYSI